MIKYTLVQYTVYIKLIKVHGVLNKTIYFIRLTD